MVLIIVLCQFGSRIDIPYALCLTSCTRLTYYVVCLSSLHKYPSGFPFIYYNCPIKEKNEMGGACGTYGGRERCAQGSGGET